MKKIPIRHGTLSAYTSRHCRCTECRAAVTAYYRVRRAHRRAKGLCIECGKKTNGTGRCQKHCDRNKARYAATHATRKELLTLLQEIAAYGVPTFTARIRAVLAKANRRAA